MTPVSLKTRITTAPLAETRDWYRDLFGLAVLEEWDEPEDKGSILGLQAGEALIEVYLGQPQAESSGLSLQFRVEDVDCFPIPDDSRFDARLPEDRSWGRRYVFLTDPNGISVAIFSGTSV